MEREQLPNTVISRDGVRGTLAEGMPADPATDSVLIRFETGQQVLVPLEALSLHPDRRYYFLALRLDELTQPAGAAQPADQPRVIPVVEEVLEVARRREEIGRVRIQKRVHQRAEVVDEPLLHDEVTVTRVPINRVIEQPVEARQEADTLIVPVLEEVLVVEKRLLLVEEVHITRRTVETRQPQEVTLRREEVIIERLTPPPSEHRGTESAE